MILLLYDIFTLKKNTSSYVSNKKNVCIELSSIMFYKLYRKNMCKHNDNYFYGMKNNWNYLRN